MAMTLQQLLGIELPIVQAPMAGVQGSALAVAVSQRRRAGLAALRDARHRRHAQRAGGDHERRPAGPSTSTSSATRRPRRMPSAKRPGAPRSRRTTGVRHRCPGHSGRAGARTVQRRGRGRARSEFRPAVVSFHFGLPSPDLLARVRSAGAKILSSATTVDEARWLEAHGRRRDHRAGPRGRRPSRHVPVGGPEHAGRHVRAAAAGRAGGEGAGDRRRRHRGRRGRRRRDGARRGRRADRHGLPALPRGHAPARCTAARSRARPPATPRSPTCSPAGRRAASSTG